MQKSETLKKEKQFFKNIPGFDNNPNSLSDLAFV